MTVNHLREDFIMSWLSTLSFIHKALIPITVLSNINNEKYDKAMELCKSLLLSSTECDYEMFDKIYSNHIFPTSQKELWNTCRAASHEIEKHKNNIKTDFTHLDNIKSICLKVVRYV